MAYFEENSEAMVALEKMVDDTNLSTVLWALAFIAWQKEDHIRSNWQDEGLAKVWARNAKKIDAFVSKIEG